MMEIRHGDYREQLKDTCSHLILTSPPYNIGSKEPRSDGNRRKGLYDRCSYGGIRDYPDCIREDVYQDQQEEFFIWAADRLKPGGVLVYNHKLRRRNHEQITPHRWFLRPTVAKFLVLVEEIIWDRGSTHNHDSRILYPTTERLYVFRKVGEERLYSDRVNVKSLPKEYRSDRWLIPLTTRTNGHACPFPLLLAELVIKAWSKPGERVCDPYLGRGTTALAALQLGRRFVGAEQEQKYYEMALAAIHPTMRAMAA